MGIVADDQLNEIISSSEAWTISDEIPENEEGPSEAGLKSTISSRQVKALFEQILGSLCILLHCPSTLSFRRPVLPTP